MMKLYYSAGSCSMSCHIALEETGIPYEAIKLDWDKPDANLAQMEKLNPLQVVPILLMEDGKTLTQNTAILEYIADKKPSSHLLAPVGTPERYETAQWLSFIAADLHKSFVPLFAGDSITSTDAARAEVRKWSVDNVNKYLAYVDSNLAGKDYITGKQFTAADCYLFVVTNWCAHVGIKTDGYKNLSSYMTRVYQRPAVQRAMKMEGLLN